MINIAHVKQKRHPKLKVYIYLPLHKKMHLNIKISNSNSAIKAVVTGLKIFDIVW